MVGNCTGVPANPDVAGIGLRVSIYVQTCIALLYPILALAVTKGGKPARDVERVSRYTLVVTGCGILLSTIADAAHRELTMFHALILLNLSWIVTLAAHSSATAGWYARHADDSNVPPKVRGGFRVLSDASSVISNMTKGTASDENGGGGEKKKRTDAELPWGLTPMAHLTFMSAVGLWVFTDPSHFPRPLPSTDTCAYLIFGHGIPVQSSHLRTFWLVVYGLGFVPILNGILLACAMLPLNFSITIFGAMLYGCCYSCTGTSTADGERRTRTYAPRLAELGAALFLVCAIAVSTEVMLLSATSSDEDGQGKGALQWTLGETFALFLTIPGLVAAGRDIRRGTREKHTEEDIELLEPAKSESGDSNDKASRPPTPRRRVSV